MDQETAEKIFRTVNEMTQVFQSTMTDEERTALEAGRAEEPEVAHYAAASAEEALFEFSIDALGTLAGDMHAVLDGRQQAAYRQALEAYYATEELARDPEHAHLAEHVKAMRLAHEKDFGVPPPPRHSS